MWTQIAWRSALAVSECEKRLGTIPRRALLIIREASPLVVARPSGRMFRLFIAGAPARAMFAPHFYGSLIDKHVEGTEIRGRLFPAPITQGAVFLSALVLVLLGIGAIYGMFASLLSVLLAAFLAIGVAVVGLGWRRARQGSDVIEATIERAFEAHRLTPEWSRRAARI
jgi:hypothetical protein